MKYNEDEFVKVAAGLIVLAFYVVYEILRMIP